MLVPYCASWHDLQRHPSCSAEAFHSAVQREAATHRTRLLFRRPAPGRHQASPSHFNCGWHCLKTCRGKATQVLLRSPHTNYLKRFYGTETFSPVETRIYLVWRRDALWHTHTASEKVFRHRRGLKHLTCPRWGAFKRMCIVPCCCPLNVTQMCQSICVMKLKQSLNKRPFVLFRSWHLLVPHLTGFPSFPCRKFLMSVGSDCNKRDRMEVDSTLLLPVCLSYRQADSSLSAVGFSLFALDNWVTPELLSEKNEYRSRQLPWTEFLNVDQDDQTTKLYRLLASYPTGIAHFNHSGKYENKKRGGKREMI